MSADDQLADQVAEKVRLARIYLAEGSLRLAATCLQHAAALCLAAADADDRAIAELIDNLHQVNRP